MRERLEKNYQLNLKNSNFQKTFIIDSFIGEGASCLVYDAKYIDELGIIRNVRIKELYPLECKAKRNDDQIIWSSEEKKAYYILEFEALYKRQIHFQNMINFTNSSTQIIDNIYEANNTKYIILDCAYGKTFDKYQPNHLQNIFEVILSLTKLVKKYHNNGYLMLDIKPENFLTIDETNQLIKYLDFDSILSLYAIKNYDIKKLSCSLKYAAPELIRKDIGEIDKCSDIYSIGAILYKKIFELEVTSKERSIGFNPNYDNKYFTNINPKIYKKLTSFFRKTLCNNSRRRYQTCDEMILDLEELIEISNPNSCILLSSNIIQKNYFVGRNKECLEIDQAFRNGKNLLFINGYGGIGKTEFAKYYANSRKKDYHTIIFGKCTNGLKEVFENEEVFTIKNLRKDDISLEERINTIKQLVDEDTLVVIDNLDVLNDPYFETLCSFNCKLLITTRANLDGIISNTNTTQIIQMKPLAIDDAYDLFIHYYQRNITEEEKQAIYELIKHIEGFTLMIPILAKQMMLESIVPSTMLNKLKNNKLKGISTSLIKHYKDNNIIDATAYDQALGLFDIFELSNDEKEVLYIMSLLGNVSISKRTLALFAGQFDTKLFDSNIILKDFVGEIDKLKEIVNVRTINSLIEKGYLDYDSVYDLVRCHNIIRELSLYEFNLSIVDTNIFKRFFTIIIEKLRNDYCERNNSKIEFSEYKNNCLESVYENELKQLCFNIFSNVDFANIKDQEFISKNLLRHIISSGKDYLNVIKQYLVEIVPQNIKLNLLSCDFIQKLCLNYSSEELIDQLKNISKYKYYPELSGNLILLINEISIYPYLWFKEPKLLSTLESFLKTSDEQIDEIDFDYDNNEYIKDKLIDDLLLQLSISRNSNLREKVIFDGIDIDSLQLNNETKIEEDISYNFKNIYSVLKNRHYQIEYPRSLHKVSNYCEKDIKDFEYIKTENDIEMPLLLSLLKRYLNNYDIIKDQLFTYSHSYSAFDQLNENIYEYFARKNDYMFMTLQLKQFNILKNIKQIDAKKYLLHSYQINTIVGKLIADLGEPSILLETLRIYIHNIITKENLDDNKYKNIIDNIKNTKNYTVNNFYNNCIEIGKKYHDTKLLQLIEKSKREIIGIDISYHDPELSFKNSFDCEVMWNRIEELYNKCIHVQDFDEINNLRDEILVDTNVPTFFKTKLLNCIHPKISYFDSLLIDKEYICKKYTCDISSLEVFLRKERNHSFEGVEELINLLEICLQYILLENQSKVVDYIYKINKYVNMNIMIDDQFNIIIFKLVFEFIKFNRKLKNDSICKILVKDLYYNYSKYKSKYPSYIENYLENFEEIYEFEEKNRHVDYIIDNDDYELMKLYYYYHPKESDIIVSEEDLDKDCWLEFI